MNSNKMDKKIVKYFVLIAVLVLAIYKFDVILAGAQKLLRILNPLILGAIMAYVLNIVLKMLEKIYFKISKNKIICNSRRGVCIALSFVIIFLIIYFIFNLVIPELINALTILVKWIPNGVAWIENYLNSYVDKLPVIEDWVNNIQLDWDATIKNVAKYVTTGLGGILGSTIDIVSGVGSKFMNFVIGLIFAIYLLANKEKLANQLKRMIRAYCKPTFIEKLRSVFLVVDDTFSNFIIGQCTEAVILGSLCALGMWICQFPYALMVGTFVGATALIPIVGAYIGGTVGFVMILTVSPIKALFFLLFLLVLQQLEGDLIYPKVVGQTIGLPGIWVLAAVTVGGGLFGIVGMLIGVPVTATLYKLLRNDVNAKNMKLDIPKKIVETGDNNES